MYVEIACREEPAGIPKSRRFGKKAKDVGNCWKFRRCVGFQQRSKLCDWIYEGGVRGGRGKKIL